MNPLKRWRNLLLVALLAALSFGGSFECHGSSGDHDDHDHDVNVD